MSKTISKTSSTLVTGQNRFKYFKRPIMPKINPVPPSVLLAPTIGAKDGENINPLEPIEIYQEPVTKTVEVQTMYRESEAQTNPYTPDYSVQDGENPELLLLKDLTYESGLPLNKKDIEMIEFARSKKELENSLPPFTDEASLNFRKRLMEQQEMKEFKLREEEIDNKREQKMKQIEMALLEREESTEFLISQRVEGVRLLRMEEREKVLQKIKNKRIKALRRLAHQRDLSEPILSDGNKKDIIDEYFDRGSATYAPVKRVGKNPQANTDKFEAASRTAPLDTIGNIINLEYNIPQSMMGTKIPNMSKTMPVGAGVNIRGGTTSKVSEPRLTSAAQRSLRMTKRDIEEMHNILQNRKREATANSPGRRTAQTSSSENGRYTSKKTSKGRPRTPDFTKDRYDVNKIDDAESDEEDEEDLEDENIGEKVIFLLLLLYIYITTEIFIALIRCFIIFNFYY